MARDNKRTQCDFYGCTKPICAEDYSMRDDGHSQAFCTKHSQECNNILATKDASTAKKFQEFWIRSYGTPELLAKEIVTDMMRLR